MVNTKDVVIDDALDQVEDPEADQQLARPAPMGPVRRPPEDEQTEDVGAGVEEAIPEGVDLQIGTLSAGYPALVSMWCH